jgi:hypothetical protein
MDAVGEFASPLNGSPPPPVNNGPPPVFCVFLKWQLGGSRWVQNTPTGCGKDLPTRQHHSENFQKSPNIEKCKQFFQMFGFGYFINRGGVINRRWGLTWHRAAARHAGSQPWVTWHLLEASFVPWGLLTSSKLRMRALSSSKLR